MRGIHAVPVGGALALGCWAAASAWLLPFSDIDWGRGPREFERRCAACHSVDPADGARYGPNLADIGATAGERKAGLSAEEYIIESMLDPSAFRTPGSADIMPARAAEGLSRSQIVALAAYLMGQGAQPDYGKLIAMRDRLERPELPPEQRADLASVEAGRRLFFGKGGCSKCHELRFTPGAALRAPVLLGAGRFGSDYLAESVSEPNHAIRSGYETWNVWLRSGEIVSGRLLGESGGALHLLADSPTGEPVLQTVTPEMMDTEPDGSPAARKSAVSPMPSDIDLNEAELSAVVRYLETL